MIHSVPAVTVLLTCLVRGASPIGARLLFEVHVLILFTNR